METVEQVTEKPNPFVMEAIIREAEKFKDMWLSVDKQLCFYVHFNTKYYLEQCFKFYYPELQPPLGRAINEKFGFVMLLDANMITGHFKMEFIDKSKLLNYGQLSEA